MESRQYPPYLELDFAKFEVGEMALDAAMARPHQEPEPAWKVVPDVDAVPGKIEEDQHQDVAILRNSFANQKQKNIVLAQYGCDCQLVILVCGCSTSARHWDRCRIRVHDLLADLELSDDNREA